MEKLRGLIHEVAGQVTDSELAVILTKFRIKKIKKDQHLLRQGQVCRELCFVKSGCFKVIYPHANREINVWFAFEEMPITEMQSFITQSPSQYTIRALENAEVFAIEYNDLQKLYEEFSSFRFFGMRIVERILAKSIQRMTSFQFETAEARYEKLFANPNYLNRVPLKDLASFLGVTPNSLSRIRNSAGK
ncbi:Crp/Fnr family transcriptional regulator [Hymenobacter sp. BT664]|uniref:Crp/Fnr family transcriptional regulator n=1 Tax=Hymenobacter montanus TaxID=2771359 RepID=A0A927GJ74_9BACT|nr:Crp/Fnr family transcriptional regulator [Hymenobacter montanus]MBD2768115.1 Crp/Fnr family transcriptional regulator [Hymenobacter montanus]